MNQTCFTLQSSYRYFEYFYCSRGGGGDVNEAPLPFILNCPRFDLWALSMVAAPAGRRHVRAILFDFIKRHKIVHVVNCENINII